jgi:hypothetical protein
MTDMIKIAKLKTTEQPYVLNIEFSDGLISDADLESIIFRSRHFGPLRDNDEFRNVEIINFGGGIAWPKFELDYSAGSLHRVATVQRKMTGRDFRAWQKRVQLTEQQVSDVLGTTVRTVRNYRDRETVIPRTVQIACDAVEGSSTMRSALVRYRPRQKPGRKPAKRSA